ncbi:MAG: aminotransferase class V-fold PLP-dependent enzyme [Nodosilinea sp.]
MIDPLTVPSLNSLAAHRQQFPALHQHQYFNYGGQGPMAQATLEAVYQTHQRIQTTGPFSNSVNQWLITEAAQTREVIGAELGVAATTITLTEDVTVGCNIPLWGLPWQGGDHILLSDCEHPGVVAAVQEICRRYGASYSFCPLLETLNGGDPVTTIASHLTPHTRLLMISHILWNTGQVLPLQAITQLCHGHSPQPVLVLVDAAQSVGAMPLNLTDLGVDFYAFTGHKWWCGPAGLGGLYVRPDALDRIHPTFIGWRGITIDGAANPTGWKPDGQRFEVATSDYPLQAGLRAAIAIQNDWGTAAQRYERICNLSQRLWSRLGEVPQIRPLRNTPPDAGLVSFWVLADGGPSPRRHQQLVETLETQGLFLRTLLAPNCVRACVHYLTLESEIDRLVETIQATLAKL